MFVRSFTWMAYRFIFVLRVVTLTPNNFAARLCRPPVSIKAFLISSASKRCTSFCRFRSSTLPGATSSSNDSIRPINAKARIFREMMRVSREFDPSDDLFPVSVNSLRLVMAGGCAWIRTIDRCMRLRLYYSAQLRSRDPALCFSAPLSDIGCHFGILYIFTLVFNVDGFIFSSFAA